MKIYDVAIIGAGPAGMAAAIELIQKGVTNILLIERDNQLGGILNQCIHPGFGLTYYKEELTGPEYARRMEAELRELKVPFITKTTVIEIKEDRTLLLSSKQGLFEIGAKTILMATGCRERTRENVEVAGTRPSGIFSAGLAQKLINCHNLVIGKRVIIQGSGDIGLIMARRLALEGYEVIALFEKLPYLSGLLRNKIQCLDDFSIPLHLESCITQIRGEERVSEVEVQTPEGIKNYSCDTVLFSVGLISELDLLPKKREGIFLCGNARAIHDLADDASIEAKKFAWAIARYLKDGKWDEPAKVEKVKSINFNRTFFDNKKDKIICTLCPRACTVTHNSYGCNMGKDFFEAEKGDKRRILTTTIKDPRYSQNIPLRSTTPLPLKESREIIAAVLKEKKLGLFQACPPWRS